MEKINVYWLFRSPYSYLATPGLVKLVEDYDVEIDLRVVLPIAVRSKSTLFSGANRKPGLYIVMGSLRRAEFFGLPMVFSPKPDPVVQNYETLAVAKDQPLIMRLAKLGVEAQRQGHGQGHGQGQGWGFAFAKVVSALIFGGTEDWDTGEHLAKAAQSVGLDFTAMEGAIKDGDHLDEIDSNHKSLDAAGHWGVTTMVLREELLFGQAA